MVSEINVFYPKNEKFQKSDILLFLNLPTIHKPKTVMIQEEMHHGLQKMICTKLAYLTILFLPFFYLKNMNFKKSFCLRYRPPNNNSQTKNRDDSSRNAPCTAKILIWLEMHSVS